MGKTVQEDKSGLGSPAQHRPSILTSFFSLLPFADPLALGQHPLTNPWTSCRLLRVREQNPSEVWIIQSVWGFLLQHSPPHFGMMRSLRWDHLAPRRNSLRTQIWGHRDQGRDVLKPRG